MAENVDELRLTGPFYCHHCEREIACCSVDYTCTACNGGFIEPTSTTTAASSSPFHPDEDDDEEEDEEDEEDDEQRTAVSIAISHGLPSAPSRRAPGRRARISFHRLQNNPNDNHNFFQNFLQQFLHGLMGGNNPPSNNTNPYFFNSNINDFVWTRGGLDNIITMFMNQLDNTGPPPAGKDAIEKLPSTRVPQQFIDENIQCHVCMEDFVLNEEVKQLPCKHVYHQDCITPWLELHGTCPICRNPVEPVANTEAAAAATAENDGSSYLDQINLD